MQDYKFGEIVLLQFPFTSGTGYKKRPALILFDSGDADVIVARVTSQVKTDLYDIVVKHWQTAGLKLPSIIRLHKIATLEKALIDQRIGELQAPDATEVRKLIAEILKNI
ncbi:MAG: type II toxin-antitoxin system PemK/MazF family toxin [Adhaeribacter sp.]